MAYVPPHKRHSKDSERPSPTPESLIPKFKRNLDPRSFGSNAEKRKNKHSFGSNAEKTKDKHSLQAQGVKFVYANDSIHRWFNVGLADDAQFPSVARLQPFSVESIERRSGEKPLALVLDDHLITENNEISGNFLKSPWVFVAENVQQDFLTAIQNVKNVMDGQKFEDVTPNLVARFGRVLFLGAPSGSVAETTLSQQRKTFYTNVSQTYMDYIISEVVPKIGLVFEKEKELYHLKVSDNMRPDSTISCKCSVSKEYKKIKLYKIELNQVRHLGVDMSCLGKNLDLRLMLSTKRAITALTEDEMHDIERLISSAVLDPDVKGGLRWPLGKESSGDRYTVCGVWHTNAKAFKNSSIKLKARHADRFDFRSSIGEVTREVTLKMIGIISQLLEQKVEVDLVSEMLKDNLQLIWESFLCNGSST